MIRQIELGTEISHTRPLQARLTNAEIWLNFLVEDAFRELLRRW
jgi:hypothetical protein